MTLLIHKCDILVLYILMLNLTKGRVGIFCSFWGENEAHNLVHTSGSLAIQDKKHLLGWDPLILFSSARWYRSVVKRFEFISEIPPVARTPQPPPLCPEFACRAWQIGLTSQFCRLLTKWVILDKSLELSDLFFCQWNMIWIKYSWFLVSEFPTICGPQYSYTPAGT